MSIPPTDKSVGFLDTIFMKIKIAKEDCLRKDLKIPEGYRIIKDWELLKEIRTGNKKLIKSVTAGSIFTEINGNVRASWLYYFGSFSGFYADSRGIDGHCRLRGVFIKK